MSSSQRSALGSLFCLLCAGVILASAQDWDSCDSLQHYVDLHPNCSISNYGEPCSGLFCYDYVSFSYYYNFIVQKCEDPVTVDVFVYWNSHDNVSYYDYFDYLYNQSETVDSNGSYTAIMERNASHLGFELYLEHDEGSGDVKWLFDAVYIPLDPADCMCSSMENVAADIHLTTNYSCNTTAVCNVITCDVFDSPLHSVDVTVNPCDNPPSLDVNIDILGRVRKIHANDNTTTSLGSVGVALILTLWHYDYSMDVELTTVRDTTSDIILPRHKIILDLTGCGHPHPINISSESTEAPTEFTEPTVPSTTDSTYDTCEALHSISVVDGNLCSANRACNALECEIVNQRLEMAVDSCHDPPGIRLVVYDSTNHPVFNRSFYNGSYMVHNRSLPFNLNVTVLQIPPSAISVEIAVVVPFINNIPLVPKTVIPIDRSSCSSILPPPTSAPGSTCSAMQYIQSALARSLPGTSCSFPLQHNCTVLTCFVGEGVEMTIQLLRCAHPPAVRVTLGNSFLTYFDHTFDHSEVIPVNNIPNLNNVSLNVTMDQLCPSDVGFQVDFLSGGRNSPIIPYTIIPVNTTGCGPSGSGVKCSTTTAISTPIPTATSPSPTPIPKSPFATSCDAMKNISEQLNSSYCYFVCMQKGCSEIDCSTKTGHDVNFILHCSSPIGMEIKVHTNSSPADTESTVFSKSGKFNNSVDVTVNIGNKVLGFGMVCSGHTLVNYTLIPLDTCGDSSSSTSNSGLSTAAMVSAIAVPVVLLLLIVTVVVIVVGVYFGRRHHGRNYRFHRMHNKAMSELDEDC